ncbi:hypothetical protein CDL12_00236 [Handroanthus impetiginosus]|uniref:RING-type domain-containing protein n=1 Tax=Handroanthus impetiginosus TaxID=429701 RepID=A0A2G9IB60_9LAMI|nr:hypothetical protein CDL12_00236 [Handroanthus impetiginosus]
MRYLTDDGALPSDLPEEQQRGLFLEIYEKIRLATWDKIPEDEINLITERVFDEGIGGRGEDEEDIEICIVCFDELYKEKETIRGLGCGHDYHDNCIERWLERTKSCPLRNAKVTTSDDGSDDDSDEYHSDYFDFDGDDEEEEDEVEEEEEEEEEEDDDDDDDDDEEEEKELNFPRVAAAHV